MSTPRRALVTGGAGFIGRHLVRALVGRGVEVRVLDDLSVGAREALPNDVELLVGDVRDASLVARATVGIDVVFHLAARVSIRGSVERLRDDFDVNLGGTLTLLEALRGARVSRFVNISSMAVYADSSADAFIAEDHTTRPLSPYGASKLAAEHYTRIVTGMFGVSHVNLRYFNTYGPGQTVSPYVGVATIFIDQLLRGQRPTILGDGAQRRDFVHVDDIVAATVTALDAPVDGETINIGTGRATTVSELAALLCSKIAPELLPIHAPPHAEELRSSVADITRARRLLGFTPRETLDLDGVIAVWRERHARG